VRDYRYPLMINGVAVRIWAGSGRILVHVHDTGPGPADPLAGLVSVWAGPGLPEGGLWLVHMLGLDARPDPVPGRLYRPTRRRAGCLMAGRVLPLAGLADVLHPSESRCSVTVYSQVTCG